MAPSTVPPRPEVPTSPVISTGSPLFPAATSSPVFPASPGTSPLFPAPAPARTAPVVPPAPPAPIRTAPPAPLHTAPPSPPATVYHPLQDDTSPASLMPSWQDRTAPLTPPVTGVVTAPAPFDTGAARRAPQYPAASYADDGYESAAQGDDQDYDDDDVDDEGDDGDDGSDTVGSLFDDSPATRGHGVRNGIIIVLVLAILAGLGYVGYTKGRAWLASRSAADYPGPGQDDVVVSIPSNASAGTMGTILLQNGVVASQQAFVNAVKGDPTTFDLIQAGSHQVKTQMSATEALAALADPTSLIINKLQIPEGLRLSQVFATINQTTGVAVSDLQAVANDPSSLGLPDWAGGQLEGFLYPDTYAYPDQPTPVNVMKPMVTQFMKEINSLNFLAKAQNEGLTPMQALTLASIIQREGATAQYAPDIAQVFMNRLAQNMPLQSDATVAYANNLTGTVFTTNAERQIDSQYNTYKYTGLPPGPISNAGEVALSAAVNPSQGNYLYFCVVNLDTGETTFSADLAGQTAAQNQLQAWCNASAANKAKCG